MLVCRTHHRALDWLSQAQLFSCLRLRQSTESSASLTQPQTASPPTRVHPLPDTNDTPPVEPQLQKCGFVFGFGALELVPRDLGAEQAENCFWQAFQHCRPAILVFNTGAKAKFTSTLKHTFTIYNENVACLIADVKQIGSSSNAKISL